MSNLDLFGEPPRSAELEQYFTPAWLAERMGSWVPTGSAVLEPSCGRGNLIRGALQGGARRVEALDIDPSMVAFAKRRFAGEPVIVTQADFLDYATNQCDVALINPPYADNKATDHTLHALTLVCRVIALVHSDFEFSLERQRRLWSKYRVIRRAIIPERPFPGASRNYVVIEIVRGNGTAPVTVREERWLR